MNIFHSFCESLYCISFYKNYGIYTYLLLSLTIFQGEIFSVSKLYLNMYLRLIRVFYPMWLQITNVLFEINHKARRDSSKIDVLMTTFPTNSPVRQNDCLRGRRRKKGEVEERQGRKKGRWNVFIPHSTNMENKRLQVYFGKSKVCILTSHQPIWFLTSIYMNSKRRVKRLYPLGNRVGYSFGFVAPSRQVFKST